MLKQNTTCSLFFKIFNCEFIHFYSQVKKGAKTLLHQDLAPLPFIKKYDLAFLQSFLSRALVLFDP